MYEHEASLGTGLRSDRSRGYADTFLDLPTPRLAEMPLMSSSQQSNASSTTSNSSRQSNDEQDSKLDHPRLIRTSSIEQEGLSHFLEQTNLDGSDGGHGDELYQLAATPLISARKSPFGGAPSSPVARPHALLQLRW